MLTITCYTVDRLTTHGDDPGCPRNMYINQLVKDANRSTGVCWHSSVYHGQCGATMSWPLIDRWLWRQ